MNNLHPIGNANDLVARLVSIGDVAIYLLMSLAFLYIVWNVVQYIIKGNSGEGRTEAIQNVGWGIVGLAIILSIWGLVNILLGTFSTSTNAPTDRFPEADYVNSRTSGSINFGGSSDAVPTRGIPY